MLERPPYDTAWDTLTERIDPNSANVLLRAAYKRHQALGGGAGWYQSMRNFMVELGETVFIWEN